MATPNDAVTEYRHGLLTRRASNCPTAPHQATYERQRGRILSAPTAEPTGAQQIMNHNNVYKVSERIVFRGTSQSLIMAFDKIDGVMYEMNETSSELLRLIDGRRTLAQILEALKADYDGSEAEIVAGVEDMIDRFEKAGIVSTLNHLS